MSRPTAIYTRQYKGAVIVAEDGVASTRTFQTAILAILRLPSHRNTDTIAVNNVSIGQIVSFFYGRPSTFV